MEYFRYPLALFVGLLAAGCERGLIEGTVRDFNGDQPLPGVAVHLEGTSSEALTDALGRFRINYIAPGELTLRFEKTNYTQGLWRGKINELTTIALDPEKEAVRLHRLPLQHGVYLFEDQRYEPTAAMEPKLLKRKESDDQVRGIQRDIAQPLITNPSPVLVVYSGDKMFPYAVQLCELEQVDVAPPSGVSGGSTYKAWVKKRDVPVETAMLDEIREQLYQVVLNEPLTPGVYAVHWGALDGNLDMDSRLFYFRYEDAAVLSAAESKEQATESAAPAPRSLESIEAEARAFVEDDEG